MKKALLGAVALTLFTGSTVLAQPHDSHADRNPGHSDRNDRDDHAGREWSRGQTLPREYFQERYAYTGWRDSGLHQPQRGYQWMLIGNQFVLVATRSGVIAEIGVVPVKREDAWQTHYQRTYTYNDDVAYTGCRNQPDPAGVLAGALLGGLLGNAAGGRGDRTGTTVAGVIAGGAVGAALTAKLDCNDRSYAYKSYSDGFNGGRANAVYKWSNPQTNHRGEMHVLDYYRDEDHFRCAVFTQTVYVGNHPEEARGRACQQPNGTWAIID